jgi:hypothetical protein
VGVEADFLYASQGKKASCDGRSQSNGHDQAGAVRRRRRRVTIEGASVGVLKAPNAAALRHVRRGRVNRSRPELD